MGKAGQRSSHNQESLDKKSRDLWNGGMGGSRHPLDPSHGSPNCCGHHSCVWGVGRWCTLARRAVGPDLSAQDRWQQQRRGWSPLHSLLPVCAGATFPRLWCQAWVLAHQVSPQAAVLCSALPWPAPSSRLKTGTDSTSWRGVPARSSLR